MDGFATVRCVTSPVETSVNDGAGQTPRDHTCPVHTTRADVEHLVVGAGLSGLLLARALLRSGLLASAPSTSVLITDPVLHDDQPITLAYWSRGPTELDPWAIGSWDVLRLVDRHGRERRIGLGPWRYTAVDWGQARADMLDELVADPRVVVRDAAVTAFRDLDGVVAVQLGTEQVTSSWAYDSRPPTSPELAADFGRVVRGSPVSLMQTFQGLWVHTESALDVSAATLADFSCDDGDDLGFSYVLPTGPATAMVMSVRMGADPGPADPHAAAARLAAGSAWVVDATEGGQTPLVSRSPTRRHGRRTLVIGNRGGRVRPSTGYAVTRILDDTSAIVRSLQRHGHPFDIAPDPRWQRALDTIWLRALQRERAGLEPAFLSLFAKAPIDCVLRFLDGSVGARDLAAVVRALPPAPFLRAALRRA